jgi:CheY-like chemotaxis protein
VVLCDIGLPGMDGYAVARALRADPKLGSIPLVALTGYALPEDVERATAAGFDAHLAKPADAGSVEEILAALVPARASVTS